MILYTIIEAVVTLRFGQRSDILHYTEPVKLPSSILKPKFSPVVTHYNQYFVLTFDALQFKQHYEGGFLKLQTSIHKLICAVQNVL